MKASFLISLIIMPLTVHAEIYKCETANGNIAYQQLPCASSANQSTVSIQTIEQEQIEAAQLKLQQELQEREELEAQRAEALKQQQQAQLKEQELRLKEEIIDQTKLQTQAIQENTEALENNNNNDRIYISKPYYPKPVPSVNLPVVKPLPVEKPVSGSINIKINK